MKVLALLIFAFSVKSADLNQLKKDRVIKYFKFQATKVLEELSVSQEVFQLGQTQVDLNHLRNSLEKTQFKVSEKELVDNTGSLVDIIGEPLSLTLHLQTWIDFQKANHDLRALIIHELLRTSSINDDDYLLSRPLYSLLEKSESKKEVSAPYCNLRVAKTKIEVKRKKFSGVGFEPMNTSGGAMIFTSGTGKRNISYENAVKDLKEKAEKAGYYGFQYINGQTSMERRVSNGFHRSETKTTIKAYCFKDRIKKRKKKEIRKDACQKINSCEGLYKAAPEGQVQKSHLKKLSLHKKEYKCAS